VICFNHSRPWGSLHLLPIPCGHRCSVHGPKTASRASTAGAEHIRKHFPLRRGGWAPWRKAPGWPPTRSAFHEAPWLPPLQRPKSLVRLPAPLLVRRCYHRPPGWLPNRSFSDLVFPGCPGPTAAAASRRDPLASTPLQGVPLSPGSDHPVLVSLHRRPVPPGTDPCGPDALTTVPSLDVPVAASASFPHLCDSPHPRRVGSPPSDELLATRTRCNL
jgi:hypothetical protein